MRRRRPRRSTVRRPTHPETGDVPPSGSVPPPNGNRVVGHRKRASGAGGQARRRGAGGRNLADRPFLRRRLRRRRLLHADRRPDRQLRRSPAAEQRLHGVVELAAASWPRSRSTRAPLGSIVFMPLALIKPLATSLVALPVVTAIAAGLLMAMLNSTMRRCEFPACLRYGCCSSCSVSTRCSSSTPETATAR